MIGVSFNPGQPDDQRRMSGPNASAAPSGVQEAIKILSLRLPRVVGANAISPQALLSSPGGGGSRVDSVVNQILSRYFPQAQQGATAQPSAPPTAPAGGGWWNPQQTVGQNPNVSGTMPITPRRRAPQVDYAPPPIPRRPNVVVDMPPQGDFTVGPDGRPVGPPPGSIGTLPNPFAPLFDYPEDRTPEI